MSIKIIGAGFGRTGTSSMKIALEVLGFDKCYHMEELLSNPAHVKHWEDAEYGREVDWPALFEGYKATVDFPGYRNYKQLLNFYPDAKVILTVRDAEKWHESCMNTIFKAGPTPKEAILLALKLPFSSRMRKLIRVFKLADRTWKVDFQRKFHDKAYAISIFNKHIEEVKKTVKPDNLLIFDVKDGWEPLCKFLNVPVPETAFPRTNDTAAFQNQSRDFLKGF